jgi:hypothetical protein
MFIIQTISYIYGPIRQKPVHAAKYIFALARTDFRSARQLRPPDIASHENSSSRMRAFSHCRRRLFREWAFSISEWQFQRS